MPLSWSLHAGICKVDHTTERICCHLKLWWTLVRPPAAIQDACNISAMHLSPHGRTSLVDASRESCASGRAIVTSAGGWGEGYSLVVHRRSQPHQGKDLNTHRCCPGDTPSQSPAMSDKYHTLTRSNVRLSPCIGKR